MNHGGRAIELDRSAAVGMGTNGRVRSSGAVPLTRTSAGKRIRVVVPMSLGTFNFAESWGKADEEVLERCSDPHTGSAKGVGHGGEGREICLGLSVASGESSRWGPVLETRRFGTE